MANWLTDIVQEYVDKEDTVLDLCCGIGNVVDRLACKSIVGVDAYEPYIEKYKLNISNSSCHIFDLNNIDEFSSQEFYKKYDVVLWIDGIEHLKYDVAINILEKIETIAIKKIIIFTPENQNNPNEPTLNHPESVWGINGGDEWQIHKCALPRTFFEKKGYECRQLNLAKNVYDETNYYEMIYIKRNS